MERQVELGERTTTTDLGAILALPESRALADDIAVRLRDAILRGYFGPGERLGEELLARSMGVSRGPIREALARLEREGLVVIRRNRGAVVARLSVADLEEVHTLRLAIERLAVERAARFAGPEEWLEMEAIVAAMAAHAERGITEQEAAELDLRFHDVIYHAGRHRRLLESWTNLRPQIQIVLLSRNVAHPDFRDYLVGSHQAMLDALRDRAEARALALLDDHLRGSYERVAVAYARRLDPQGPHEPTRGGGRAG